MPLPDLYSSEVLQSAFAAHLYMLAKSGFQGNQQDEDPDFSIRFYID